MVQRPNESEYPAYYQPYVKLVPESDLVQVLQDNLEDTVSIFEGISEENSHFRYADGKWSVKEVLGHITDTERIMSYRLLRVGRGDETPLAGFEENSYVRSAGTDKLPLENVLDDFIATRKATLTLIQNMPAEAWTTKGIANNTEITTRAIAHILTGHAIHHLKIVKERYGA